MSRRQHAVSIDRPLGRHTDRGRHPADSRRGANEEDRGDGGARVPCRWIGSRRNTMRYTLLLHYPEMTADELGDEALAEGQQAFTAYAATLHSAGVLLSAEVLQP